MADGHDEVGADEDHDLAGLDDLAGIGDRLVLDVVDGLEHQKQGLVVAFQLRSLMGVHGVLDGQLVQAEHVGHGLHLMGVGFVQADPDERVLAGLFEFVHLVQRRGVGVLAGQPGPFAVDAAIDHRPCDGDMNGRCVGVGRLRPHGRSKGRRQCAKRWHRVTLPSSAGPIGLEQCYAARQMSTLLVSSRKQHARGAGNPHLSKEHLT